MLAMPDPLDLYREIRMLSAHMVDAARAGDWEQLIVLESRVAAFREVLCTAETSRSAVAMSTSEGERKRGLILQILEDDAEVRRHAEPWLEHVRQFLGSPGCRGPVPHAFAGDREPAVGAAQGLKT